MNKFFLFDADGVAISPREKYFSQRLSDDYGVSSDLVMPLFKNEFLQCLVGKDDLRDVLKEYIPGWGWKGSVDDLLHYWWAGESKLNVPVLEIVDDLRRKKLKCYLATDQEKYRAEYLMKEVGLEEHFDGVFFSCNLGVQKHNPEYWKKVLAILGELDPKGVIFFDDEQENVEAARAAGIQAYLYTTIENLESTIKRSV